MSFYIDAGGFLRYGEPPKWTTFLLTVIPSFYGEQFVVAYSISSEWISTRYFKDMSTARRSAAQFRRNGTQAIAACIPQWEEGV